MKIIKHSKEAQKQYHTFTCKCGCSFQCEEDEYWEKPQVSRESSQNLCSYSYSAYKTFITCCPECHKVVEDSVYDSFITTVSGTGTLNLNGNNVYDRTVQMECDNKK